VSDKKPVELFVAETKGWAKQTGYGWVPIKRVRPDLAGREIEEGARDE